MANFPAMKRTDILMIEIVLNFFITQLEKFDRRLRSFIFQSIDPTHTCKIHPKILDVGKMHEIKKSFINLLKSMGFYKTFCIVIRVPIFHVRMKYFKRTT